MVTLKRPSTTLIYTRLAELGNHVILWLLLRAFDSDGSGQSEFTIKEIVDLIGVSRTSVLRWIVTCLQKGLFRSFTKIGKGAYRVYYTSLVKATVLRGLTTFGDCIEVYTSQLRNLKYLSTEWAMIAEQRRSRYAAEKKLRGDEKPDPMAKARGKNAPRKKGEPKDPNDSIERIPKLASANLIINGTSGICTGVNRGTSRRITYVFGDFIRFGASQEGLANKLDRHPATIRRRLSNPERNRVGLHILYKTQVAVRSPMSVEEHENYVRVTGDTAKRFAYCGSVWELHTNLYWDDDSHFKSKRHRRNELNRYVDEGAALKLYSYCCGDHGNSSFVENEAFSSIRKYSKKKSEKNEKEKSDPNWVQIK